MFESMVLLFFFSTSFYIMYIYIYFAKFSTKYILGLFGFIFEILRHSKDFTVVHKLIYYYYILITTRIFGNIVIRPERIVYETHRIKTVSVLRVYIQVHTANTVITTTIGGVGTCVILRSRCHVLRTLLHYVIVRVDGRGAHDVCMVDIFSTGVLQFSN